MMWQHGDVLITAAGAIPPEVRHCQGVVRATSEITGHSHQVEVPEKAEVWEYGGERFLKVIAITRVIREGHRPITLEPGIYRVWQQREYTPKAIRCVLD